VSGLSWPMPSAVVRAGQVRLAEVPFQDRPWESKVRPVLVVAHGAGGDDGATVLVRCFYSTWRPGRLLVRAAPGRGLRWDSYLEDRTVEVPVRGLGHHVGDLGAEQHPARRSPGASQMAGTFPTADEGVRWQAPTDEADVVWTAANS